MIGVSKGGQLIENFCSNKSSPEFYEPFATRRYNFGTSNDHVMPVDLLKDALKDRKTKPVSKRTLYLVQ